MMPARNSHPNHRQEPKVIAIAAVKPSISSALIWQMGMALLAYSWLSFLAQ
jgi:hypothetical protein